MNNWDTAVKATETAMNSQGSAMRENERYMQSLEAKINLLTSAWQEFAYTLGESGLKDLFAGIISLLTQTLGLLTKFFDTFGFLPTIAGIATAAILTFTGTTAKMTSAIVAGNISINTLSTSFRTLATSINVARIAAAAFQATITFGISVAVAGLIELITRLISSSNQAKNNLSKIVDTYNENTTKITDQLEGLRKLSEEYDTLRNKTNKTQEELNKMSQIEKDLVRLYGVSATGINAQGEAYADNTEQIKIRIKQLEEQNRLEKELLKNKVIGNSNEINKNLKEYNKDYDYYVKKAEEVQRVIDNINNRLSGNITGPVTLLTGIKTNDLAYLNRVLEGYYKNLSYYQEKAQEASKNISETSSSYFKVLQNELEDNGKSLTDQARRVSEELAKSLSMSNIDPSEGIRIFNNAIRNMLSSGGLNDLFKQYDELKRKLNENPFDKNIKNQIDYVVSEIKSGIEKLFSNVNLSGIATKSLENFTNQFIELLKVVPQVSNVIYNFEKQLEDLSKSYDNASEEVKSLNKLIEDVKNGRELSADSIAKMIIQEKELVNAISVENGQIKINIEAVEALRDAKIKAFQDSLNMREQELEKMRNALNAELEMYGIQIQSIKEVGKAKAELLLQLDDLNTQINSMIDESGTGFGADFAAYMVERDKRLRTLANVDKLDEYLKTIEALKQASSIGLREAGTSSGSGSSKERTFIDRILNLLPTFKEQIQDAENQLKSLNEQILDTKNQMDIADTQGDIPKRIELEKQLNVLLEERMSKYHEIAEQLRSMRENEIIPEFDKYFSDFRQGRNIEDISKEEIANYANNLEKQLNNLNNRIGRETSDSIKAQLEQQKQGLENRKELFNYYIQLFEDLDKAINEKSASWIDDFKESLRNVNSIFEETNKLLKDETQRKLEDIDEQIEELNRETKKFNETSQEYRNELQKQIELLKQKQDIVHNEAEALREQLANGNLTIEQTKILNDRIRELSNSWWDFQNAITESNLKILTSQINETAEAVKGFDYQLQLSQARLKLLREGTAEYSNELALQIDLLNKQLQAEKNHEQMIRQIMANTKLTAEEWKNFNEQLQQSILSQANIVNSINDIARNVASKVVDSYKKAQEAIRESELKRINSVIEAENKRHEQVVKNLDDELNRFENAINEQLKLLDRQFAEEDYQSELTRAQKEAQDIQSQINALLLDDSYEAAAKRKELEQQLADRLEDIEKMKENRSRELRKQSLQDQLNKKRQEVDAAKNAEDQKNQNLIDSLNKQKDAIQQYWDDILNNDQYYIQMENEILAGHFNSVQQGLFNLMGQVSNMTQNIGSSLTSNVISNLQQAINLLNSLRNGYYNPANNGININSVMTTQPQTGNQNQTKIDHDEYVRNKIKWQEIYEQTGRMDTPEQVALNNRNNYLRNKYGFPDYNYEDILKGNIIRFDTGGITPAFGKNPKLAWLDEKELVLNKFDTSNILKVVNITRDIIKNIRIPNFNTIQPKFATSGAGDIHYHISMNIERVEGNVQGGKTVFNEVVKGMQRLGKRF